MGTERAILSRVIVITSGWRKHGNGGVGGGRQGSTGKKGQIFEVAKDGTRTALDLEHGKEVFELTGTTFKDLSRKLRATGLIPPHVAIDKKEDTSY